jgi:predicted O-methyltransferase YrrM
MNLSAIFWRIKQWNQYWKCEFSAGWDVSGREQIRAARTFAIHGAAVQPVQKHLHTILESDSDVLEVLDFGAVSGMSPQSGSNAGVVRSVQVKTMISRTASSEKWGRLLLRLAQLKSGKVNLELGTNLGIGLRYLVTGSHFQNHWISIEGDPNTANLARNAFSDSQQVTLITGRFSDVLPQVLEENHDFGLVFIDGHHDGIATQKYADAIFGNMTSGGWMVLDDIRWSLSMKHAWEQVKTRPWVDRWVDLGKMGILVVK